MACTDKDTPMTPGRLDVTIKINELPTPTPAANGWQRFALDCDGREVTVTVRPVFFES